MNTEPQHPVTVKPPTGIMQTEPAITIGIITAFVVSAMTLLVSFGIDLNDTQQSAIVGFVAAAIVLGQALLTRLKVFSPNSVQKVANNAAETGVATVPPPPAKGVKEPIILNHTK